MSYHITVRTQKYKFIYSEGVGSLTQILEQTRVVLLQSIVEHRCCCRSFSLQNHEQFSHLVFPRRYLADSFVRVLRQNVFLKELVCYRQNPCDALDQGTPVLLHKVSFHVCQQQDIDYYVNGLLLSAM